MKNVFIIAAVIIASVALVMSLITSFSPDYVEKSVFEGEKKKLTEQADSLKKTIANYEEGDKKFKTNVNSFITKSTRGLDSLNNYLSKLEIQDSFTFAALENLKQAHQSLAGLVQDSLNAMRDFLDEKFALVVENLNNETENLTKAVTDLQVGMSVHDREIARLGKYSSSFLHKLPTPFNWLQPPFKREATPTKKSELR